MSIWRNDRPWAPSEIERLKRFVAQGKLSMSEIAQELGRSRNSVGGQLHRLGLRLTAKQRPPVPKQRRVRNVKPPADVGALFLNGEPLIFADTSPPCARCGVREDVHLIHGCGQFAGELRVRDR